MRRMKATILLLLLVSSCYVTIVQCNYGGRGFNPLGDHLRDRMIKHINIFSKVPSGSNAGADDEKQYIDHLKAPSVHSPDFTVYVGRQEGLKEKDMITSLPGQPEAEFNQYSGYVHVSADNSSSRVLFYYFTESTNEPLKKPLVLWLNGGPGCSSIGAGAMSELGPFRVNSNGKTLMRNQHAWNKKANILFLESPVGVGFSYSSNMSDYKLNGDIRTAQDNYHFLINWLERFPEYKNRDFFITGESYAGHYVPQLAQVILDMNKKPNQTTVINLQGIAVGNPLLDDYFQLKGTADYFYSHSIISKDLRDQFYVACSPQNLSKNIDACTGWQIKFNLFIKGLDIYDIYAPLCNSSSDSPPNTIFDPCTARYINAYMNKPEVQKALHANITGLPYPWGDCSSEVLGDLWKWQEASTTVLNIIRELAASGLRVWIYSGDTDGACPVTTTEYGINALGLQVKTKWYAWANEGKEVGGYAIEYSNLTFLTIRGSGHFVPSNQPARAMTVFSSFLEGKLPPAAMLLIKSGK